LNIPIFFIDFKQDQQMSVVPAITRKTKMCPIIWRQDKYGINILTLDNSNGSRYQKPVFLVPLKKFLQSGAIWQVVNLCTIFWEPPAYGIQRAHLDNERVKGAYLIEFASDLAPLCKAWARGCIEKTIVSQQLEDEVFVEIILFNEALVAKMIDAIHRHELTFSENENIYTVI
jgi:hypothetical protein